MLKNNEHSTNTPKNLPNPSSTYFLALAQPREAFTAHLSPVIHTRLHRGGRLRDDLRGPGQRGQGRAGSLPLQPGLEPQVRLEAPAQPQVHVLSDQQVGPPAGPVPHQPQSQPQPARLVGLPEAPAHRRVRAVLQDPGEQGDGQPDEEEPERAEPRREEVAEKEVAEVRGRLCSPQSRAPQEARRFGRQSRIQSAAGMSLILARSIGARRTFRRRDGSKVSVALF